MNLDPSLKKKNIYVQRYGFLSNRKGATRFRNSVDVDLKASSIHLNN